MSIIKPAIPKGTRDFGPVEMARRTHIFDTIKSVFRLYGFQPLETPTMENLSTLTGKYGDEGDQLIFKVLNSGDFLSNVPPSTLSTQNSKLITQSISEKALRYDLTVPFARYVVMNQHNITFPFKRYQVQPVWRADRPQKGRYREFYQCDADVVGSKSLLNEAELVKIYDQALTQLGLKDFTIKINHRKLFTALALEIKYGGSDEVLIEILDELNKYISPIVTAIDKIDKIGEDAVKQEIKANLLFITDNEINKITEFIAKGTFENKLQYFKNKLTSTSNINPTAKDYYRIAIEELEKIFELVSAIGLTTANFEFDTSLARGLSYYTGAIFEVKANGVNMGSIGGGGRYDDLTGIFGLPNVSGVGISFGADRIYDVMEELHLFPETVGISTQVLFVNFSPEEEKFCLKAANILRSNGINTEIYPEAAKMKKQMGYADDKNIPYVALVGSNEMQSGQLKVKDMKSGEQKMLTMEELINLLK